MKKALRTVLAVLLLMAISVTAFGCGAKGGEEYGSGDEAYFSDVKKKAAADRETASEQTDQSRKIIEYVNLDVETKSFDKLIDDITATVKQSGGYIESSDIDGNSYSISENRTAELKVRIPRAKQTDFSDFISQNANVVNRTVNTEDVTEKYIDLESRVKALAIEKETLENLLKQAKSVSDTLTVYEKLTDIIAEIESYKANLNRLDGLIEYTTFTVVISEVERETKPENGNWFVKTWNDLIKNLSSVGKGFLSVVSFMISSIPYWIILGVAVFAFIIIRRRIKRKNAEK